MWWEVEGHPPAGVRVLRGVSKEGLQIVDTGLVDTKEGLQIVDTGLMVSTKEGLQIVDTGLVSTKAGLQIVDTGLVSTSAECAETLMRNSNPAS